VLGQEEAPAAPAAAVAPTWWPSAARARPATPRPMPRICRRRRRRQPSRGDRNV